MHTDIFCLVATPQGADVDFAAKLVWNELYTQRCCDALRLIAWVTDRRRAGVPEPPRCFFPPYSFVEARARVMKLIVEEDLRLPESSWKVGCWEREHLSELVQQVWHRLALSLHDGKTQADRTSGTGAYEEQAPALPETCTDQEDGVFNLKNRDQDFIEQLHSVLYEIDSLHCFLESISSPYLGKMFAELPPFSPRVVPVWIYHAFDLREAEGNLVSDRQSAETWLMQFDAHC